MIELVTYSPVTINDIFYWLGIDSTSLEIGEYESIILLANGVISNMEQITRRKLFARDYDYENEDKEALLDGNGRCVLWLPEYPVNSISYLSIDDVEISCTNDSYDDYSGYKWWKNGKLYYEDGFSVGDKNVKLKYNAGYNSDYAEYSDLKRICLQMISYYWQRKGSEGMASERIGNYSYTLGKFDDLSYVRELEQRYSRQWEL